MNKEAGLIELSAESSVNHRVLNMHDILFLFSVHDQTTEIHTMMAEGRRYKERFVTCLASLEFMLITYSYHRWENL